MEFPALDRIAALSANLEKMQHQIDGKLTDLKEVTAEGTGADGLIRVVASPDGRIVSTFVNPRALRLDSQTLAEEFTAAANRAHDEVAAKVREAITGVIGQL